MRFLFIFTIFLVQNLYAYELVIIQNTSREKQTFITRGGKENGIFTNKKSTFTAQNVSLIATAIVVTRDFTQWEIENNYTDIPFKKGQIVTMYDTEKYLWALNPEDAKRKFIKSKLYEPRKALEAHLAFTRGLSETVSADTTELPERGGYIFEGTFLNEINSKFSYGIGFRYTKEIINVAKASFNSQRFMGVVEIRYSFDPFEDFYNSQISLGLGAGLGQSRTETSGQTSFGDASLLPTTKFMLAFPISKTYDFAFEASIDSLRTVEQFEDASKQSTNLTLSKFGVFWRKYI